LADWRFVFLVVSGLPLGLLVRIWTRRMINQRQPNTRTSVWLEDSLLVQVAWALTGLLINGLILLTASGSWMALVWAVWFYALLMLSVVDWEIRKIPNETLALLIIAKIFQIIILRDLSLLPRALLGLVAGYFFFAIPVLFGRTIGQGDVKLAAVIGFCIGIGGMLQSIAVMSLGIVINLAVLLKNKRGNLKTKVAIGPYLSIGMVVSVLFPLLNV